MTNKELFYFIGKCLIIEEHPGFREEIIQMIADDRINWESFISTCSNHLILPVIYLKFSAQQILDYLPEAVAGLLKEITELSFERNKQILKQLEEVTAVLNQGNIYPVYLKGAGNLLDGLYSNQAERLMGDIDFLVPEKDYLLAAQLLTNAGYSADIPSYFEVQKMKHYPRLFKADVPCDLEIHRIPVSDSQKSWFNSVIVESEKKSVTGLSGCFVLSDKHRIIHNFIHSQLANSGHLNGIVSFRDIYDLYLLSKRFEVGKTIPEIKTKQRAIAYFVFAGQALGIPDLFYTESNYSYRVFAKKHHLNLTSKVFYHSFRILIYIYQRIIIGFTGQIIQAVYSKKMRQSIAKRISNREYLIAHFKSHQSFFSPNKH